MRKLIWLFLPFLIGFIYGILPESEVAQATVAKIPFEEPVKTLIPESNPISDTAEAVNIEKQEEEEKSPDPLNKEIRALVYKEYAKIAKSTYNKKYVKRIMRRMQKHQAYVKEASQRYGYEPNFLVALAGVESAGKEDVVNDSSGAVGLFQLLELPRGAEQDVQRYLGRSWLNWHHPRDNTLLGAATLKDYSNGKNKDVLLDLVAYNWGPNRKTLKGVKSFDEVKDNIPYSVRLYALQVLALFLAIESIEQHGEVVPYDEEHVAMLDQIPLPGIDY